MSNRMQFLTFKAEIQNRFMQLENLVASVLILLASFNENAFLKGIFKNENENDIKKIHETMETHMNKIKRQKMKCVFFGQTSNGKSAMINAILGCKVLPSSDGRTTSCFITIEGCNENTGYFMIENKKEYDLSKLSEVADEVCKQCMSAGSQIQLFWPKENCDLLKEDVQILDSPGADFSKENDKWIETYCLDSDIFVFVVNGEATINESETAFFRKVNNFIKNSRIFVVMNKWDRCDTLENEKRCAKTKEQHLETARHFLRDDLKIDCDPRGRTFFLSAKERLEHCDHPECDVKRAERNENFNQFYQTLCKEMSENAIVNKFGPHLDSASEYISTIMVILETLGHAKEAKKSTCARLGRDEMIKKIRKFTKDLFKEIIEDGELVVGEWSSKFAQSIMSDRNDESLCGVKFGELIQQNMMKSLSQIFETKIKQLVMKIRGLFVSCSEFALQDQELITYLPSSFKEHVTCLEQNLTSNFKRDDSKLKKHHASKEGEKKGVGLRDFLSAAGGVLGQVGWPLMIKFPMAGIVGFGLSGLLSAASSLYPGTDRNKEIMDYVKEKTEEMLLKDMHECYRKVQEDIDESMEDLVSKFCSDHDSACELVRTADLMRVTSNELLDEVNTTRAMIMSLGDQR